VEYTYMNTSFILHETARRHHWEGEGALSIKTFRGGRALYNSGGGLFAVDDHCYLVLNQWQRYTITVDSPTPIESLCIFFTPGLAEDVFQGMTTPLAALLDEPWWPAAPINFFERTYPHDQTLSPVINALCGALGDERGPVWLDEQLHGVMVCLLQTQCDVFREVERLPQARAATRDELYRRVHRARDFATASLDQPLTLDDLARVACLSPNHLLRAFRQVFHQSPRQYLISLRLNEAQRLLRQTDLSVTEISLAVGFESLGSFSWTFQRRFGVSPLAFRRPTG
jgi:AraC family transcriptional regulator